MTEGSQSDEAAQKTQRKQAVKRLGWKIIGQDTVDIKIERSFMCGSRTVVVRGRVNVPLPSELTVAAGDAAIAPLVDPTVEQFAHALERAGKKILSEPDPSTKRHIFEQTSFFSAIEHARRGMVQILQELENRRLDERVEADLGLRFYVEHFTHEERQIVYYVGPTNSGKTHAAIELLRAAKSGVYLAPLRLLALEVYEKLRELGINVSLITGEERHIDSDGRHVSSTVEMVNLAREIEVAVVDEAQMLADEQRGWAWTLAIAGVRAKTVILCGSEDGLIAARRLTEKLGLPLSVRRFERKNPLHVVDAVALSSLRPGDALIAFSRNAVVDLQSQVARGGRSTAAIYGSLSPAVRRREAERFRNGEADILIATDAIGLGLNLPIRRIIFASVEKFDGTVTRTLTPPEVRQIAGRAGRYGIHEEGLVSALDPRALRIIRHGLEYVGGTVEGPIWISPTDEHLQRLAVILGTTRIARLLQFFQTRVLRDEESDLRISDLSDAIKVSLALEASDQFVALPLQVRSTYSRAPVSIRENSLAILTHWGELHAREGAVLGDELLEATRARDRLLLFEDRSRLATLYLWLAQRFPDVYVNVAEITKVRERTDDDIQSVLLQQGKRQKQSSPTANKRRKSGPPKFDKRRLKR